MMDKNDNHDTTLNSQAYIEKKAALGGGMSEGVSFFERNSQHDKYHTMQGHRFAPILSYPILPFQGVPK